MITGCPRWFVASLVMSAAGTCAQAELRRVEFDSPSLGRSVALAVHLPPSYAAGERRYPLVVALHGLFETEGFWERRGLRARLDELWARQALPEFVLLAPGGGNSFFLDGPLGKYESVVTADVLKWAGRELRVDDRRERRGLWGVSMGGYAALRIALKSPALFGRVATHSAMLLLEPPTASAGARGWHMGAFEAAFGTGIDAALWRANDPLALASTASAGLPALSFDCGSEDRYGLGRGHERLHEVLQSKGVSHTWGLHPGNHGYEYVHTVFEAGLRALSAGW